MRSIRIGGGLGFYGDSWKPVRATLERGNVQYVCSDHLSELTLAIKLSANPASPAKRRGLLYAGAHRWDDAKRDFSLVVEHEPNDSDGWLLRSQVELAQNDLESARADFEHARAVAPAGWSDRPDVARMVEVLNGKR